MSDHAHVCPCCNETHRDCVRSLACRTDDYGRYERKRCKACHDFCGRAIAPLVGTRCMKKDAGPAEPFATRPPRCVS